MRVLLGSICLSVACQHSSFPLGLEVVRDSVGEIEGVLVTDMGGLTACRAFQQSDVAIFDLHGEQVWLADTDDDPLWGPHNATLASSGQHVAVSDTCNDRVLVYDFPAGQLAWDSAVACPELELLYPNAVYFFGEGLEDGLLVTVLGQHVVVHIDPAACGNGVEGDEILWQYGAWGVPRSERDYTTLGYLSAPHNAFRHPGTRHILIADSAVILAGHSRVLEVDEQGELVWSYHPDSDCGGEKCPALQWTRDVDLLCDDEACDSATVLVTDDRETVGLRRHLGAEDEPVELRWRMRHRGGIAYDADWLPSWAGDDNRGEGWLMISHHGFTADESWVRVVPADAADSDSPVWEL